MKPIWGLPLLLVCILTTACGNRDAREVAKVTAVWSCMIGTQGGFTGGGDGYEIFSNGRVLAWSRTTADAETERRQIGHLEEEQLLPLIQALAVRELHTIELQESGNMTTFLEARSSKHPTKRWSWPADRMGGRTPKVPALVQDAYDAAWTIARQFGGRR